MLAVIGQQLRYREREVNAPNRQDVRKFLVAEMKEQTGDVIAQSWDYAAKK
jgi:hypothetical protein